MTQTRGRPDEQMYYPRMIRHPVGVRVLRQRTTDFVLRNEQVEASVLFTRSVPRMYGPGTGAALVSGIREIDPYCSPLQ